MELPEKIKIDGDDNGNGDGDGDYDDDDDDDDDDDFVDDFGGGGDDIDAHSSISACPNLGI